MVKKGLPPVFSCTRCERGSMLSTSQTSASASRRATSSTPSGPRAISSTLAPAAFMRSEGACDGIAPFLELCVALAQDRPDDASEGLREARIRNVTLVLVELAAREQAARKRQRLVKLVHHRRLADARSSRNEKQLRR